MEGPLCGGFTVWRGPCVELRTLYGGVPVWRGPCVELMPCVKGPLCGRAPGSTLTALQYMT